MSVDLFGRQSKKTESTIKLLSNGGLTLRNDSLSVKIDPNINNTLTLSANGVMASGIKTTGGVMTGNLSMGGNRITNLETGSNPQDAVTKHYVDTITDSKITKDGEINMNNNRIINVGQPQSENDVASKRYCDEISRNMLSKTEGVMLGNLNLNWNNIRNVNFPDYEADAVNKIYVQILYQNDEIGMQKLINICNALSPFLERDPNVQKFRMYFNSRYMRVISLNDTITSTFKSQEVLAEFTENNLVVKELKIIVLQIILALQVDNFTQLKEIFTNDKIVRYVEKEGTLRRKYYRIVRELMKKQRNDNQIDLIAQKNLILIQLGYIFIDEMLL